MRGVAQVSQLQGWHCVNDKVGGFEALAKSFFTFFFMVLGGFFLLGERVCVADLGCSIIGSKV